MRMRTPAVLASLLVAAPLAGLADPVQSDPIACYSVGDLYRFTNARDTRDEEVANALLNGHCQGLRTLSYKLVEEKNGVDRLRVYEKPGDRGSSRVMFTLQEMVPDLRAHRLVPAQ
jgi:hypothetical protein